MIGLSKRAQCGLVDIPFKAERDDVHNVHV